jgi:hypothetical protein
LERDANTFGPVLGVYAKDVLEGDGLSTLEAFSRVTVNDLTADMPMEFFIAKHAEAACAAHGGDYTGKRPGKSMNRIAMY